MSFNQAREAIQGVVGIPVVPYDNKGAVDHAVLRNLLQRLVRNGISVLTQNGNTGEYYALSPQERREVLITASHALGASGFLIAGVGLDLETAQKEAQFASEVGASAVMVHQPALPYLSRRGWVEYNRVIAAAVPDIAIIPYLTSTSIRGGDIAQLVSAAPNVVGVKYSVPDPAHFGAVRAECTADLVWVAGLAESHAPAYWQYGSRGFTSGLVNLAPQLSLGLLESLRDGDADRTDDLWSKLRTFEDLRTRNGSADNVSVVKEAMYQRGLCPPGVRPPSSPLDDDHRHEVRNAIAGWEVPV